MKCFFSMLCAVIMLSACEKLGPGDSDLNVMTFVRNEYSVVERYEFQQNGNVYHYLQVGDTSPFDTEGCALYYTLDGEDLVIYYGVKGWKKEVRNTVYSSGTYHGDYIEIEGNVLNKQ